MHNFQLSLSQGTLFYLTCTSPCLALLCLALARGMLLLRGGGGLTPRSSYSIWDFGRQVVAAASREEGQGAVRDVASTLSLPQPLHVHVHNHVPLHTIVPHEMRDAAFSADFFSLPLTPLDECQAQTSHFRSSRASQLVRMPPHSCSSGIWLSPVSIHVMTCVQTSAICKQFSFLSLYYPVASHLSLLIPWSQASATLFLLLRLSIPAALHLQCSCWYNFHPPPTPSQSNLPAPHHPEHQQQRVPEECPLQY